MKQTLLKWAVSGFLAVGLSACAGADRGFREFPQGEVREVARDYTVAAFDVLVPRTLEVSEANLYYPIADIVWRGDRFGDRYDQIEAIFDEAGDGAAIQIDGDRPVRVTVQVTRFHSVTEKARTQVGGVHSIRFYLAVYDVGSDEPIEGPRLVVADFPALGGEAALWSERQGETMRSRVIDRIKSTLVEELTEPSAPDAADLSASG